SSTRRDRWPHAPWSRGGNHPKFRYERLIMQAVYQPHPSPTRDTAAEQGVGTARREEPNMLPRTNTRVVLGGRTQIGWKQSAARENKGGVLPASKPAAV